MIKSIFRTLMALLLLLFVFAGCSSSSGDSFSTAPPQAAPSVGTIQINQVLLRAIPSQVTQQRFTGFDSQGLVGFGPVTEAKAATITLENVSTAVTRLQIEYLQGDVVIGLGSVAVSVVFGEVTEISDPPFQDVTSALDSIQVTPGGTTIADGSAQQFTAIGTFADNTQVDLTSSVTWVSSETATATIEQGGRATAVNPGDTVISAHLGPVTGNADLTVSIATISSIAVTPGAPAIANGTTQQFTATATLSDDSTQDVTNTATWNSATTSVATIDINSGLATAVDPGQSVVTATVGTVTGVTTLTVTNATVTSVVVTPVDPSIADGTTLQFIATANFSSGPPQNVTSSAEWNSSVPTTASIVPGGLATAESPNATPTVITATFDGVSGNTELTVTDATIESIEVTPDSPAIADGTMQQFTATATLTDRTTQDVTMTAAWTSGTPATATIDTMGQANPGLATAVDPGQTLIAASVGNVTGETTLTVTPATIASIAINPPEALSSPGTKRQYTAIATLTDSTTQDITSQVTWSADNGVTVPNDNLGPNSIGEATIPLTGATSPATITATLGAQNANSTLHLGAFAYVANFNTTRNVSVFTIDPNTGVLENTMDAVAQSAPFSVAVHPTGRFAYTANLSGNSVSAFTIDPVNGALGNRTDTRSGRTPISVTVDPTGRFAYTADFDQDVSVFTIDPSTGALSNRINLGGNVDVRAMTVDPTGRFAYVLPRSGNPVSILTYTIDSITGALGNRMDTAAAGSDPVSVSVDPTGRFAYVANSFLNSVSAFTIDPSTGVLGNREDRPTGNGPQWVTVDPTGRFVYVANSGSDSISAFTIDPNSGILTPTTPPTFPAADEPASVSVDPTGRFAYATNRQDDNVSAYTIDPTTGNLTPTNPPTFPAGVTPQSVVTSP